MQTPIEEIVRKLHSLPQIKILEVLDFVDLLTWNKIKSQKVENDSLQEDDEFETTADILTEELKTYIGDNIRLLSDYAVSRAGIYGEHP